MQSRDIILKLLLGLLAVFVFSCKQSQPARQQPPAGGNENLASITVDQNIQEKTVEGVASGFDCAVVSVLCPSTHRAADYTTGIFTDDKEFYFVVNIPQSFMTEYFLELWRWPAKSTTLTTTLSNRKKLM
jgi:hypothetical protein